MRTWILTIFALAIPASGCTRNAATFWEEYVRLSCRFSKKCAKAAFNDAYDDMADCKDDVTDRCSPDDFDDACADYDGDEAKECLSQTREQIRKCEAEDNDDACDWTKICGDDPATQTAIWQCIAGSNDGYDGMDGYPPDATGLEVPFMDELSQPPDEEEPAGPNENG